LRRRIPHGKTQPQSTPDPFPAERPTNVTPTHRNGAARGRLSVFNAKSSEGALVWLLNRPSLIGKLVATGRNYFALRNNTSNEPKGPKYPQKQSERRNL
jgi:hypothetical protein